jgi:Spy/CpxP family protein refolding chaperone
MKRNLITIFAALALALSFACGGSNMPTASEDDVIEQISEEEILSASHFSDLSDDQKARLRAALQEARQALAAIRADLRAGTITREEARVRARQVHDALIEKLESLLTEEQLERLRNRHDRGDALTPEQLRQIHALRQDLAAFARSLRDQVHDGTLTAEEAREELRAAVRRFNAAVCGILNAGQRGWERFCAAAGG